MRQRRRSPRRTPKTRRPSKAVVRKLLTSLCVGLALLAPTPALAQVTTYKAPDGSYQSVQGVSIVSIPPSTVVTLTAASTSGQSADQNGLGIRGMKVGVNCTAVSGTSPTLAVAIQGKDPSGTYFTILQSASITTTGFTLLSVYPGMASTANVSANDFIPQTWRISYTIGGTTPSFTCTISSMPE